MREMCQVEDGPLVISARALAGTTAALALLALAGLSTLGYVSAAVAADRRRG